MKRTFVLALLLGSCAAPPQDVTPQPGDFAFLEVSIKS